MTSLKKAVTGAFSWGNAVPLDVATVGWTYNNLNSLLECGSLKNGTFVSADCKNASEFICEDLPTT